MINVPAAAENPSTMLKLISLQPLVPPREGELEVTLGSQQDIPLRATLHFVIQSVGVFPLSQSIEVATADGVMHTTLIFHSESLILQDQRTVVGSVDLYKAFGESAFGELRLRAVQGDGTPGSWVTMGRLVRLPHIKAIQCTEFDAPTCMIEGSDLFLSLAFSSTETFESEAPVPTGFDEPTFVMSMPASGARNALYMRLRDDPRATAAIRIPPRDAGVSIADPLRQLPEKKGNVMLSKTIQTTTLTDAPAYWFLNAVHILLAKSEVGGRLLFAGAPHSTSRFLDAIPPSSH